MVVGVLSSAIFLAGTAGGCGSGDGTASVTAQGSRPATPAALGSSGNGRRQASSTVDLTGAEEAKAREMGRQDCAGKTPLEVAKAVEASARRAGTTRHFLDLVIHPAPRVAASPAYPQLVAALYVTTLPPQERSAAAAGCAEELAASTGRQ